MDSPTAVCIDARPESLTVEPQTTAVIVVDMQHDFAAPGGMFDSAGVPIESIQGIVAPTQRLLSAARANGITVVRRAPRRATRVGS